MNTELRTIDELDVERRRVLLRADFNVPLKRGPNGAVHLTDDTRNSHGPRDDRGAPPARRRSCRLVLGTPHGARSGAVDAFGRQSPGGAGRRVVTFAPAVTGSPVRELTERLALGEMLMLENVPYEPGETDNDPELVSAPASSRPR